MKKAFIQTIIVFVVVNLITAGFALAQNVTEEKSQPASKEDVAAEKEKADVAAKVAQEKAKVEAKVEQVEDEVAQIQAQIQMEAAQRQMEAAEKQMQAQYDRLLSEQKQLELQIPKIEVAAPRIPLLGHSGGGAVLVVPAAEMKTEDLAAITEDMSVMSRIFANKLNQARLTSEREGWVVNFDPFSGRNIGTTEAIYLEGYAALFLMNVNFPLSPTPEAQQEKKTEEKDTDPLWTQMRQEMYAPEEVGRGRSSERQEEKYDAEKVAELKETLVKTLKHAANIRALKPDQSVILTVIGGQSQSGMTTITRSYSYRSDRGDRRIVRTEPGAETVALSPTMLTICAKKSDIDAFAKGELSLDQFWERTRFFSSYAKFGSEDLPNVEESSVAKVQQPVF